MKFDQFKPFGSSRKVKIRGANFKPDEDVTLFMAWEDISFDAVVKKDQMSAKYWKHIEERFKHHLGWRINLTLKYVTNQWGHG